MQLEGKIRWPGGATRVGCGESPDNNIIPIINALADERSSPARRTLGDGV